MADIKDLNIVVANLMNRAIALWDKNGFDILVTQGYRTIAYQNSLYAIGRTLPGTIITDAKGGYSAHNYGLAFDICGLVHGAATYDLDWNKLGALGKSVGLTWGGDWVSFPDRPHFEYTFGLSISDLVSGKRPPNLVKISAPAGLVGLVENKIRRIAGDIYKIV